MTPRPQFSLRTLMIVMALVCLAAATMTPLRPTGRPTSVNGSAAYYYYEWKDLGLAIHAQSWLRLAACIVFPTVLIAAAATQAGYSRTFCLAALLPATVPVAFVSLMTVEDGTVVFENGRLSEEIEFLGMASNSLRDRIGVMWLCASCAGAVTVFAQWLLRLPGPADAVPTRAFAIRLSCAALLTAIGATTMILLPPSGRFAGVQPPAYWQAPIRLPLCLLVPAMLGVGAVQGPPASRVFCRGGLVPAIVSVIVVCGAKVLIGFRFPGEPDLLFQWRWFILRMWVLIPVFGLTAVLCCWLFQRGETDAERE